MDTAPAVETPVIKEPFSWAKFFSGFTSLVGWTKTGVMILKIFAVLAVIGAPVYAYHVVYTKGKVAGMDQMRDQKDAEFKQWIKENPQNVVNGNNTQLNNNVQKPNNHFQFKIIPPMVGWCE